MRSGPTGLSSVTAAGKSSPSSRSCPREQGQPERTADVIEKAADILNQGVHLLVVDLFPPTPRDPHGIHKAIWYERVRRIGTTEAQRHREERSEQPIRLGFLVFSVSLGLCGSNSSQALSLATSRLKSPPGKLLIVASYIGGDLPTAYVESVGVGDPLPSLPIFLSETHYIPAPLEATYQQAWAVFPAMLKELIDPPAA